MDLWDSFVGKEEMYARDGLHLSGRGLPFLPRDCQGRLPVACVKYDIQTSWAGGGGVAVDKKGSKLTRG